MGLDDDVGARQFPSGIDLPIILNVNFVSAASAGAKNYMPIKGTGLVVSHPMTLHSDGTMSQLGEGLDDQQLRFWLLFWDRLCWPQNTVVKGMPAEPTEEYLLEAGILTRPNFVVSGTFDYSTLFAHIQRQAFFDLSEKEPGLWSLAEGERSFNDLNNTFTVDTGLSYDLYQAIPVPDIAVPLAEILEFKQKRRDELLALRIEMESLATRFAAGGDDQVSMLSTLASIEMASLDAIKVSRESKFPFRLADAKISFSMDLQKFMGPVLTAALLGGFQFSTLNTMLAAAGLALQQEAVSLKFSADFGIANNRLKDHPYRYVASYHNKLLI